MHHRNASIVDVSYTDVVPRKKTALAVPGASEHDPRTSQPGPGVAGDGEPSQPLAEDARRYVRSWSQLDNYRTCPASFRLGRLLRVPRRPGVWFPAGTAFHATVEHYLRGTIND